MVLNRDFPSVVKYMGSKTEVLDLIELGINYLDREYEYICDLFAGSSTLSGALRGQANVVSNDVQAYSAVFAKTYLNNYDWKQLPTAMVICDSATDRVERFYNFFPDLKEKYSYDRSYNQGEFTLAELNEMEEEQRGLIDQEGFEAFDNYYLFTRYYSGTYWGFEQCVWIDSFRYAIDKYKYNDALYSMLLSCLMYAMAYNSQSTGHYAQYRIPDKESSKEDILIYRRKNISSFFVSKYEEIKNFTENYNPFSVTTTAMTDIECLEKVPIRSLVYADPPYCFVHYSRFYHILETLVKYDYPEVRYKGRYRTDRYQSDYCIRSKVVKAFEKMFGEIKNREQDLVLSYSDSETNTIKYPELIKICCETLCTDINDDKIDSIVATCKEFFQNDLGSCKLISFDYDLKQLYEISLIKKPYNHSRMGRTKTKTIPVTELIIIAKHK